MATMDYITPALQQYEKAKAENTASTNQLKKSYDEIYASQAAQYQKQADSDIAKTETEYKGLYDRAALQQLVNERELERRQANLGLTDSGLTATQQTAIQVARGNADAKIDSQKQAAIDSITLQLEQYLAQVDQNRAQAYAQADYNLNTTNTTLYNQLLSQAYSNQATYDAAQMQAQATERAAQIKAEATATSTKLKQDLEYAKWLVTERSDEAAYNFIYDTYGSSDEAMYLISALGIDTSGFRSPSKTSSNTPTSSEKKTSYSSASGVATTAEARLKNYNNFTYEQIQSIYYSDAYATGPNPVTDPAEQTKISNYLWNWMQNSPPNAKFKYS